MSPNATASTITPDAPVIIRPSERRVATATPSRRPRPQKGADGSGSTSADRRFLWFAWCMIATSALAFGALGISGIEPTTAGLMIVPALAIATWMVLGRFVRPRHGAGFVALAMAGLGVRFVAAVPRLVGGADAVLYQREGERLANSFRALDFTVETGRSVPGTGALRYFAGLVNVVTGSSYIATFLIFTLLAFAGQVWFLLAVRSALSPRQFRIAGLLIMMWPSLTFWPSSIGKEAAVAFGIGLTTLGAANLYSRRFVGTLWLLIGLFAVGMVRPHIAMVVISALVVGLLARHTGSRPRVLAHMAAVALVLLGAMWLTDASAKLFRLEQLDGIEDVAAALDFAQARTSQDNSAFVAPRVESVEDYPWAFVTVMFRPFPLEANNATALVSALEGLALIGLMLWAIPGFVLDRGQMFTRGVVLHAGAFLSIFVFLFSAIGNFGILSRQRAQALPFFLLLLAVGLGAARLDRRPAEAATRPSIDQTRISI